MYNIAKHARVEITSIFRPLTPAPPAPPLAFAVWVIVAAAGKYRANGSEVGRISLSGVAASTMQRQCPKQSRAITITRHNTLPRQQCGAHDLARQKTPPLLNVPNCLVLLYCTTVPPLPPLPPTPARSPTALHHGQSEQAIHRGTDMCHTADPAAGSGSANAGMDGMQKCGEAEHGESPYLLPRLDVGCSPNREMMFGKELTCSVTAKGGAGQVHFQMRHGQYVAAMQRCWDVCC